MYEHDIITLIFLLTERGKFLALDLGGTNFRVLLIHLKGESDFEMQSKIYAIPQSIMIGSGAQLFDHIAECLANFIKVSSQQLRDNLIFKLNVFQSFILGAQTSRRKAAAWIHILFPIETVRPNERIFNQMDKRL